MTNLYLVSRRVVQIVISLLFAAVVQRRKGETFHILNHLQFEQIQTILGGGRKSYFMKEILHKCGKTSLLFLVSRRDLGWGRGAGWGSPNLGGKNKVSQYLDLDLSSGDFIRSFPLFG
jgi:hypothetical protein